MRTAFVILFGIFTAGATFAADSSLSLQTIDSWVIVCDPAATESEKHAASEFQKLYAGLTGKTLVIADTAGPSDGYIAIGPDAAVKSGLAPVDAGAGEETLRITTATNHICIDGGRPRGTLYGVYEFFEELCGVRYLTHDHTRYPDDSSSLKFPLGEHRYTPPFAFRWSYYGETSRNPEFATRLRVNTVSDEPKLGGRTGYRLVGHNVASHVPPATYGAEHPEYYALVDGQRKLDLDGGGPQLCMTNPEVLEIVVNAVLKEIEANPTAKNVNVAQMDNELYCTCENCAAIDAREESHAGATLNFVNQVAERIEAKHPDVLIGTYAYQYTRKPPKTILARRNVMIQLCSIECCQFHAIDDPSCVLNRSFCADMAGWKPKCDNVFVWHYNTNFNGYLLPYPNLKSIGKSVRYFHENNARGVFMQAAGNGFSTELSDLRNYVMARCIWKPGRDSWAEAEEFCKLHYAEAAQPILDYLAYYHDLVGKSGVHPNCFPTESALAIDHDSARKIYAFFETAMARADSDVVKSRVEKASLCAHRALLSASEMTLTYQDGICKPDLGGVDPNLLNRFADLCKKYEVSMETEHIPMERYIAEKQKLHAGLAAVKIENDSWRIVLLPEYGARIVEMIYKPTQRNVAYAARALEERRFEEWVHQGAGPSWFEIIPFKAESSPDTAKFTGVTSDGTQFVRTIRLAGDAVHFDFAMTAGIDRAADLWVHPEFDTASYTDDPNIIAAYAKDPDWFHANSKSQGIVRDASQTDRTANAVAGGAFAFYNHEAKFGMIQTFDPKAYRSMALYWSPSRRQINLEMDAILTPLKKGETARCAYTLNYLAEPPVK